MFPPPPPWCHRMLTAGVTGTNGKTTTTSYLASALGCLHGRALRITTLGSFLGEEKLDVEPDYVGFVEAMKRALDVGVTMAAVECTSESLAAGFAKAWPMSIGVFTNLSRDHFDSHGSAEHYLASKAQLFVHLPAGGAAVLNAYDPASALLAEVVPPSVRVLGYGVPSRSSGPPVMPVFVEAERVVVGWDGTRVKIRASLDGVDFDGEMHLRAIGEMYAENALAAWVAAMAAGVGAKDAIDGMERMPALPGRFEVIGTGPRAVIDYAHSPDALGRTLSSARALCAGRLAVVFGAGGGRDRGKREAMGQASRVADRIVLTSDNPRREDPALIAAAIRRGIGDHAAVSVQLDREKAIRRAFEGAGKDDVVVIAGRGPETEQVFASGVRRLVDADVARGILGELRPSEEFT